jgi:hypothetical protein
VATIHAKLPKTEIVYISLAPASPAGTSANRRRS